MLNNIRKKKKEKQKTPTEMLKEFIGKQCTISLFNDTFGVNGTVVAIEGNWIKVEEKKKSAL